MFNRILRATLVLAVVVSCASRIAVSQTDKTPFVVHAYVDERTHAVCYTLGKDSNRYANDVHFYEFLDKMHTTSPKRPFLFLISHSFPIGGLESIFLVVDKYELGPTRYFLTSEVSGAMSEIDREKHGGFSIVKPAVPISDNPK
jgi:hypothetical protein